MSAEDAAKYRVGAEIGRGALGRVVAVEDLRSGERMAGKMLHASHLEDAAARERFAGEARILGGIEHPNLVRVRGLEEIDGVEMLLMEYLGGGSLATVIALEAPLAEARILALARGLVAGLAAAHHAGLIHRDLKPANVLLTAEGQPKIVDFGLARATSLEGVERSAFALVGTPDCMAPECVDPLAVDPRSDIYSLGCMLYEMATGGPPYTAATAFALLEAHRDAPIPAVEPNRDLSQDAVQLITWMLAKSPADRPQSASVVERELAALAERQQTSTALVPAGGKVLFGGTCAVCSDPLVVGVPVCFGCGLEQPTLDPGANSVFVVGPGAVAAKIDSNLRQALLDWLRANPSIGLDPEPLEARVPRLPFVLVTGVSEASAQRLVRSLESLGFECKIQGGGRFALKDMRRKAWKLGGRVAAIVAGSTAGVWHAVNPIILPAAGLLVIGVLGSGWYLAGRRIVRQGAAGAALPTALQTGLGRVAAVVPTLREKRHRESLRAVVQRVITLRAAFAEGGLETHDVELARILDLALVAAARVDELESALAEADLLDPRDEVRAQLRERDTCAARLLEAAAFLDALRARHAAISGGAGEPTRARVTLDELRAQVEALEEVQSL